MTNEEAINIIVAYVYYHIDDMFCGSQYRGVIIDPMEMVMANILGSCELEGYSVTGWEPSDDQSFLVSKEVRP